MPAIFLNPEVDLCKTEEQMSFVLKRALESYMKIRIHSDSFIQENNSFHKIAFHYDRESGFSFFTLIKKIGGQYNNFLTLLYEDIKKGYSIDTPTTYSKTLKELELPSPFLEHAFNQKGMALSFASDKYWESDFIEFEDDAQLPNIWGQSNLGKIYQWLDDYYRQEKKFYDGIQKLFNVEFCCKEIKPSTFTPYEWEIIFNTFKKANENNFEITDNLIKDWYGLPPMRYIRDKNHSDFTLRIFFIKKNNKIYVGKIYHKNSNNTLKEEVAAEKSFEIFKSLNLCD